MLVTAEADGVGQQGPAGARAPGSGRVSLLDPPALHRTLSSSGRAVQKQPEVSPGPAAPQRGSAGGLGGTTGRSARTQLTGALRHPAMTGSLLLSTEVLLEHSPECLRFLWFSSFFFSFLLVVFCFLPKNERVTSHADLVCTGQGLLCTILHTVPIQKNLLAASSGALTISHLGEDRASPFHENSDRN